VISITDIQCAPDPHHLFPTAVGLLPFNSISGRAVANPVIDADTAVILVAGQSNAGNFGTGSAYTPSNNGIYNFNISNGGTYEAAEPLLGNDSSGFGFPIRLADKLITAGHFTKVILVPMACGGTSVAQWATGDCRHRITAMCSRLQHANLTPTFGLWHQGETDGGLGTSQAVYSARLAAVLWAFRSGGVVAPFFIAQVSYPNVSAGIRAAQADAANGIDVFLGPDTDTLTTGYRAVDGVHFNGSGLAAHAQLWFDVLDAYLA
jgi:hypothetical protein